MKKISIIILLIMVAFGLNGCLVNRIKQRMQYKEMTNRKHTKVVKKEVQNSSAKPKLYKPSPSPLKESRVYKKKVVKKSVKKSVKRVKKIKKKKTYKAKPKKIETEPYSIGDNESDPELLGPQTTLESNPLTKKAEKRGTKG